MSKSILIVEDDSAFAYAASRYLTERGYSTIVYPSSMEALRELGSTKVDAVVTDIKLLKGEPHGLAFARMLKDRSPEMAVVLMTAYPDILMGETSLPGPVLQKPFDLSKLDEALRSCLST